MLPPSVRSEISSAEKALLDQRGYLIIEDVLHPKQIEQMRCELQRLAIEEGKRTGDVRTNEYRALRLAGSSLKDRFTLTLNDWLFAALRFCITSGRKRSGLFNDTLYTAFSHPLFFRKSTSFKGDIKQMLVNIVQQQEEKVERICNLHNKSEAFDVCFSETRVLSAVKHIIGNDFKLSSLNLRNPLQGCISQPMHIDWPWSVKPGKTYSCNTLWFLDDVGKDDGPTRVLPTTHLKGQFPSSEFTDLRCPRPGEQYLIAKAGSVAIINGQVWHGGTHKKSNHPRRLLQGFFVHQAHNQQQPQNMLLTSKTKARLSASQLERLGIY